MFNYIFNNIIFKIIFKINFEIWNTEICFVFIKVFNMSFMFIYVKTRLISTDYIYAFYAYNYIFSNILFTFHALYCIYLLSYNYYQWIR